MISACLFVESNEQLSLSVGREELVTMLCAVIGRADAVQPWPGPLQRRNEGVETGECFLISDTSFRLA